MTGAAWLLIGIVFGGTVALCAVWISLRESDRAHEQRLLEQRSRRGQWAVSVDATGYGREIARASRAVDRARQHRLDRCALVDNGPNRMQDDTQ